MAEEKVVWLSGHKLEFQHDDFDRKFDIYIQEPDVIDEDTGILLISEGLGGLASSAAMKEMRQDWCNRYNVIALSVNYMGLRTQNVKKYNISPAVAETLISMLSENDRLEWSANPNFFKLLDYFPGQDLTAYNIIIDGVVDYPQDRGLARDYNDFGYIQAMDCLYAVKHVLDHYTVNKSRIFAYGSSFGGYIMQMCSKYAPSTFAFIADASGYAKPDMMLIRPSGDIYSRGYANNGAVFGVKTEPFYIADKKSDFYFTEDMDMIRTLSDKNHINIFSKYFSGQIVMFHSVADPLVNVEDKKALGNIYKKAKINCRHYLFTEKDIDGEIIKTTGHCMGADLKKLFEKFCGNDLLLKGKENKQTDFDLKHQIAYPCKKDCVNIFL